MNPLGNEFLKRNMCLFTSHLDEPSGSIFQYLSKYFIVDGYWSYFNPKIKNHNDQTKSMWSAYADLNGELKAWGKASESLSAHDNCRAVLS